MSINITVNSNAASIIIGTLTQKLQAMAANYEALTVDNAGLKADLELAKKKEVEHISQKNELAELRRWKADAVIYECDLNNRLTNTSTMLDQVTDELSDARLEINALCRYIIDLEEQAEAASTEINTGELRKVYRIDDVLEDYEKKEDDPDE